MWKKCLFMFAVIGLGVVSAKTYDVVLFQEATAGSVSLQPGEYRLAVDGSKAVFTEVANRKKSFATDVKVENKNKKFANTEVQTKMVSGQRLIDAIRLGGTKMQLNFN